MPNPQPLVHDQTYHIYNRGNNGEPLFREERNYTYFLDLYARYIEPVAETYAYCLMVNHFHFLVRIKEWHSPTQDRLDGTPLPAPGDSRSLEASRAFASFFGTYTKAFNKAYQRSGSLFEKPFNRVIVDKECYFACLVVYIHRNPEKHGFTVDYCDWPTSSYRALLSDQHTRLQRDVVLDWFGGRAGFRALHRSLIDESEIEPLIARDKVRY